MTLAIFDLDNTLLAGDSDYLWGQFLVEHNIVDGPSWSAQNERFYREYEAGTMDIHEFLRFQLRPLAEHEPAQLRRWRAEFMRTLIEPIMLPAARELLDRHRGRGDTVLIITATNRFITGPIAEALGVEHLLATEPEMDGERYTGGVAGIPCYQHGKVQRLQHWLEEHSADLDDSWFYSDSHNDLPLLEAVSHPVAVDPNPFLRAEAERRGWPVISLRAPLPADLPPPR
jgi:HAD superfamily hydrolase (TIGR01490 family)